jgi:hypothetical protein
MNATIAVTKEVTTLINLLTVEPEDQPKLIQLLRENTGSRPASWSLKTTAEW